MHPHQSRPPADGRLPAQPSTPSDEQAAAEYVSEAQSPSALTDITSDSATTQPDMTIPTPLGGNMATPSLSSWSSSSDRQLGHSSLQGSDATDRVFPIRSALSVDTSVRTSGDCREYFYRQQQPVSATDSTPLSPRQAGNQAANLSGNVSGSWNGSMASGASTRNSSATVISTTGYGAPRRCHNTFSGSTSGIQAQGKGHECISTVTPLPIFSDDSSDEGEKSIDCAIPPASQLPARGSSRCDSTSGSISENLVTVRFQHQMTEDGHAVITAREGILHRCEDEPIHAPGAVQGFGALVAIDDTENRGKFLVRYASENTKRIIGYPPSALFKLGSFMEILSVEQADDLMDHIDFIRDETADPSVNGPEVFSMTMRIPQPQTTQNVSTKLWCAIHVNPTSPNLVICEFELDEDQANPLRPPGEVTPDFPADTLNSNPTLEELTESTEVISKPLRILRSVRKRRGEAGAMQVFDIMSQVQEQLASAPNLDRFLKILVGIVKELTGFHRVMIYQFDASFNGKVVTELVDPAQTRDLYKGLHFPATDIPSQARKLYKINKVRLLYDRDQPTARLVCRTVEDLEKPLDLTHSYLRAMSPIHLKYLANMAVRSSMSISLNAFGDLWGLVACHSYGSRGMRVSFPVRKMCRLVGDTASRNIERLSYASRLQARKLINTVPTDKNPSGYIIASSDDLLRLFDADFGTLSIRGEVKILGKLEQSQEALVMLEYLRLRKFTSVMTTQDVRVDFPDLRYGPGFSVIAGCLYVPLSADGNDFIVFYRKGQVREVKWAGNPYEKVVKEGTESLLEPRNSFKAWHETVLGKCREWTEEQVETAAVLCLVYGKFIEVWRQKEAALQGSKLTRLLLANSAHEVRTPLNAIINYLEIAMEGALDQETRENLSKSHSASKSLIYVINDLLDLTKAEEGQELIKDEIFDFLACIREATEPFASDAKRKGIGYEVVEQAGLPHAVYGDHRRVRQAVANITANAVQHTAEGWVRVELYVAEVLDHRVRVEIAVQDTGCGMTGSQLETLFRDLEQVSTDDLDEPSPPQQRALGHETTAEAEASTSTDSPPRRLGLGLAIVARIVRNMDGQLRLKSEPGKGSRFVIQLPFDLPVDGSPESQAGSGVGVSVAPMVHLGTASSTASVSGGSVLGTIRPEGEVTLVDCGAPNTASGAGDRPVSLSSRKSFDSSSITSQRSSASRRSGHSNKSDAGRLIDAIQLPLALGDPEPKRIGRQPQNSRSPYYAPTSNPSASVGASIGEGPSSPSKSSVGLRWQSSSGSGSHSHPTEPSFPGPTGLEPGSLSDTGVPGMQFVTDTKTPMKPVKISDDDEYRPPPEQPQQSQTSDVLFELPNGGREHSAGAVVASQTQVPLEQALTEKPKSIGASEASTPQSIARDADGVAVRLRVLCAEDDPINMKLLRKRLEKAGHDVSHAVNGEDCASVYKKTPKSFDVVLMDMQMPIVDGLTSTKMIRTFETSDEHTGLSDASEKNRRIPIFAVSASLEESERGTYINAGFDGWILKPIDFQQLETLLRGINDDAVRHECFYRTGGWEKGGWFNKAEAVTERSQAEGDAQE